MMSEKNNKAYFCFIVGLLLYVCAAVFAVINGVTTYLCNKRIEDYDARSENAQRLADEADKRLRDLENQMQSAREQTSESIAGLRDGITELGGLSDDCDRIAETGRGIAVTADGIEERILRCLQILGAPEEDEELLDGYRLKLYDPGGR